MSLLKNCNYEQSSRPRAPVPSTYFLCRPKLKSHPNREILSTVVCVIEEIRLIARANVTNRTVHCASFSCACIKTTQRRQRIIALHETAERTSKRNKKERKKRKKEGKEEEKRKKKGKGEKRKKKRKRGKERKREKSKKKKKKEGKRKRIETTKRTTSLKASLPWKCVCAVPLSLDTCWFGKPYTAHRQVIIRNAAEAFPDVKCQLSDDQAICPVDAKHEKEKKNTLPFFQGQPQRPLSLSHLLFKCEIEEPFGYVCRSTPTLTQ